MKVFWCDMVNLAPDGEGTGAGEAVGTAEPAPVGDGGNGGAPSGDGTGESALSGAAPVPETSPVPTEPTVPLSVFNKRLSQVTAARSRAEAEAAVLRAQVNAGATPDQPTPTPTPSPISVEQAAEQLLAQREFNNKCNVVMAEGVKTSPDFITAVDSLKGVAGGVIPRGFLEAAIELDAPHEVLYSLGKNPGKAMEIFELPPAKQAMALARLEAELRSKKTAPVKQSAAPAPITPVVGGSGTTRVGGAISLDDPKVPIEDWIRVREEQRAANRGRR